MSKIQRPLEYDLKIRNVELEIVRWTLIPPFCSIQYGAIESLTIIQPLSKENPPYCKILLKYNLCFLCHFHPLILGLLSRSTDNVIHLLHKSFQLFSHMMYLLFSH